METQLGGAEVRRIHVIYFLSRKGRIEQPHLIRVHHLSRNGVHLRDIKRWLAELRGREMPESFAWSYKRRYKSGYVWQDLLDEDLITPISDNEYVLKGSEIASNFDKEDSNSDHKKSLEEEAAQESTKPLSKMQKQHGHHQETKTHKPTKTSSSEIEEESPKFGSENSTLTDDSDHKVEDQEDQKHFEEESKQQVHEESDKFENDHSFVSTGSNKKNKKANHVIFEEKISTPTSSSSSQSTFTKSRSSNGASHLFRNLITCRTVDTNDSAMMTINRPNKPSLNVFLDNQNDQSAEICKGERIGGSERVLGTSRKQQPQHFARRSFDVPRNSTKNKNEFINPKATPPYKPINGPQCSQCGKQFKPEKLHAHMKSCKGMKALAKSNASAFSSTAATAVDKASDRSAEFPLDNASISRYYLTQQS